jgi:autoinducer 2-degrading protein
MVTYLVQIQVIPEYIEAFIEATKKNVENSRLEKGVVSFDFYQLSDSNNQFVLVEIYQSTEDQLSHKETKHYQAWRETVEKMMAMPRKGSKLLFLVPK